LVPRGAARLRRLPDLRLASDARDPLVMSLSARPLPTLDAVLTFPAKTAGLAQQCRDLAKGIAALDALVRVAAKSTGGAEHGTDFAEGIAAFDAAFLITAETAG